MALPEISRLRAVVVDIEGTTTPISFVYDTLFPFAREHASRWLEDKIASQRGAQLYAAFRALADEDRESGREAPVLPDLPDNRAAATEALIGYVETLMDEDRKVTPLKSLQGEIWSAGYASGELQGEVWSDVVDAFERWRESGLDIYIYSSGSVAAQKLLFGSSDQGDLLPFINGHFDTTTGSKKETESYRIIADEIGVDAGQLLFATDNLDEADAARAAGWHVVVLRRPGNPGVGEHSHDEAETFDELP